MCYIVYKDKSQLGSTAYIEITAGKYNKKHWQSQSLFISENDFEILEFIFEYYFPAFDHYGNNNIPQSTGQLIIHRFRYLAQLLFCNTNNADIFRLFCYPEKNQFEKTQDYFFSKLNQYRNEIQIMLLEISLYLDNAYKANPFICVLGI